MWWLRLSRGILFQGSYFFPGLILTREWPLPIALSYYNKRLTVFSIGYFQVSASFFRSYSATIIKTALLFNLVPLMGSWRVGWENRMNEVTIKVVSSLLNTFQAGLCISGSNQIYPPHKLLHNKSIFKKKKNLLLFNVIIL